jgi:hypothetical protein
MNPASDESITPIESLNDAIRDARRFVRLTPRWTPLIPHQQQSLYYWSDVRFIFNPSGRRSGKTELAKRKVVPMLIKKRPWPARVLYGAPTFGQARDIFWQDLKDLIPSHWVASISETRLEIITRWGAMVRVFGFDRPRRIEGVIWDRIILDEMADCPRDCFRKNIRPALSTRGREGGCDLIGVPDEIGRNQPEYETMFEIGVRWTPGLSRVPESMLDELRADPDIVSYHWPSSDILNPKEVETARRQLDDFSFRQEYGGAFVRSGGKVAPRFDYPTHVRSDYCRFVPWLPLDWSLDFGTETVAHVIGQTYRRHVWILDEIALGDSSTPVAADEFIERTRLAGWLRGQLRIFGDVSGKTPGSAVGKSDFDTIEEMLRMRGVRNVEWMLQTVNPPIKDTVNAVRACVATVDGVVHLHIHPRCVKLIDDLKSAPWPDGSNKLRDYHWLAALRYYVFSLFGAGIQRMTAGGPLNPNLAPRRGGFQPGRRPSRNIP